MNDQARRRKTALLTDHDQREAVKTLMNRARELEGTKLMSGMTLATELLIEVWTAFPITSRESALVAEAIFRLETKTHTTT